MGTVVAGVAALVYLPVLALMAWLRETKVAHRLSVDFGVLALVFVDGVAVKFVIDAEGASQLVGLVVMLGVLVAAYGLAWEPVSVGRKSFSMSAFANRTIDVVAVGAVIPAVLWFIVCLPVAWLLGFRSSDGGDNGTAVGISMIAWGLTAIAAGTVFWRRRHKRHCA